MKQEKARPTLLGWRRGFLWGVVGALSFGALQIAGCTSDDASDGGTELPDAFLPEAPDGATDGGDSAGQNDGNSGVQNDSEATAPAPDGTDATSLDAPALSDADATVPAPDGGQAMSPGDATVSDADAMVVGPDGNLDVYSPDSMEEPDASDDDGDVWADADADGEVGIPAIDGNTFEIVTSTQGADCASCSTSSVDGSPSCYSAFNCENLAGKFNAAGQSREDLCKLLLTCLLRTSCGTDSVYDCYCGTAQSADCENPGSANGSCLHEEELALETTDPTTILLSAFEDTTLGGGVANNMDDCLGGACLDSCFH